MPAQVQLVGRYETWILSTHAAAKPASPPIVTLVPVPTCVVSLDLRLAGSTPVKEGSPSCFGLPESQLSSQLDIVWNNYKHPHSGAT